MSAPPPASVLAGPPAPGVVERIERGARWASLGVTGRTIWLTGLSGAGKSTLAAALERRLVDQGVPTAVLDGDAMRTGLCGDLGFDRDGRRENVRRLGEVACVMADAGLTVIVAAVSPFVADRDAVRARHRAAELPFAEVWVAAPLETCASRDPKGLYARAARGEVDGLTGRDSPYEPPQRPELTLHTDRLSIQAAVVQLEAVVAALPPR